jgi:transcriptional regulator with GAF, ATPase, and Fis domain
MPLGLQSKLLRFLEQGEVQRLGSSDNFRVDVRVVAATNSNLRDLVGKGAFREDLYYRLAVFPVELPPLRLRAGDLLPLAAKFLVKFCGPRAYFSDEASFLLQQHSWPGNVRELRNVVERASILVSDEQEVQARHIVIA